MGIYWSCEKEEKEKYRGSGIVVFFVFVNKVDLKSEEIFIFMQRILKLKNIFL